MSSLPGPAFLLGGGLDEWALLGAIAYLLFGPKRLPEVARFLGRTLEKIRRAADDFREQIAHLDDPPPPVQPKPVGLRSAHKTNLPPQAPSAPSASPPEPPRANLRSFTEISPTAPPSLRAHAPPPKPAPQSPWSLPPITVTMKRYHTARTIALPDAP